MSQQYPGPQQPYNQQPYQGHTYAGVPGQYPPPQPPKKRLSGWAITGIAVGGFFAFMLVLGAIVGPQDAGTDGKDAAAVAPATTAPTQAPEPAPTPTKAAEKKAPASPPAAKPKPKPAAPAPVEYADGDYVVGEDIPPGTYISAGAKKGLFEFCSITTDPTAEGKWPQLKSANADERIIITLTKGDGVVSVSNCEPLQPRK
ncbi:hypothetical protein ACIOWI_29680 [Streptomyces sp. NPDC087659]|uniref:hypothetical protein n=1 Tax=Streptomyces sp. NPDC087659 TaxID=3365801 RepID=UPI00380221B0